MYCSGCNSDHACPAPRKLHTDVKGYFCKHYSPDVQDYIPALAKHGSEVQAQVASVCIQKLSDSERCDKNIVSAVAMLRNPTLIPPTSTTQSRRSLHASSSTASLLPLQAPWLIYKNMSPSYKHEKQKYNKK